MHVEAGRAAILAYTTLIWVTPLAVLFLGERLTPLKTIGLLCGLGGVFVLFNPLGFDWSSRSLLVGNGFLIAGALAWALCILHVRAHPFRLSPLQLTRRPRIPLSSQHQNRLLRDAMARARL
jgi:drug/metabolite transporter (DMT)-like permease